MKRILALFVAVSVGVTLAPIGAASASSGDRADVAASAPASPERAAATTAPQPAPFANEVDRKKKCSWMCVQATLAATQQEMYYVNGNRHLVSINATNYTVLNLDTQRITTTQSLPTGVTYTASSLSQSGNKLMIVGGDDSGDLSLYDLNLDTFVLSQIEITGAIYPLTTEVLWEFQVDPGGTGFYFVQQVVGDKYLCFFNALGAQVDCSDSFLGSSEVSPIFFQPWDDTSIYIMGNQLLFTFDITDLTFTSVSIPVQLDTNGVMSSDGNMYFYDEVGPFNVGVETILYKLTTGGVLTNAYLFPKSISFRQIVVPADNRYALYLLGTPRKANGTLEKYSTVYNLVDDSDTLVLRKSFNIKTIRGMQPEALVIDSEGRYLLAFAGGVKTSVIPANRTGSFTIESTATYVSCPTAGWQIDWDFISFPPAKSVRGYTLHYLGPDDNNWRKIGTFPSAGAHSTLFTEGVADGMVKVLPVGVRATGYDTPSLNVPEGMPSSTQRQPRC